ncbi:hypothetical protein EDC32_102667 [Laceyella sacchari]|jgi:hypothetical protein|nr:hypothetical protein EDC32_102667 [Laceyella sacchari]
MLEKGLATGGRGSPWIALRWGGPNRRIMAKGIYSHTTNLTISNRPVYKFAHFVVFYKNTTLPKESCFGKLAL